MEDWTIAETRSYEPGIGRMHYPLGPATREYYHTDLIGSTRAMSHAMGELIPGSQAAYTAFGEFVPPSATHRFGYAGAYGYQTHEEFSFQHVGHRYYDPAIGRFLQRDPIGISAGFNLYEYVRSTPTVQIDPAGTYPFGGFPGYQPPPAPPAPKPEPNPKPPQPERPKPDPPEPHPPLPGPLEPMHKVKAALILVGPGLVAGCIADLILISSGVPFWYDGEGNQWFYGTRRVLGELGNTWRSGCKCGTGG
jgi:RHS repeat-associated protein